MAEKLRNVIISILLTPTEDGSSGMDLQSTITVNGRPVEAPLVLVLGGPLPVTATSGVDTTSAVRSVLPRLRAVSDELLDRLLGGLIAAVTVSEETVVESQPTATEV